MPGTLRPGLTRKNKRVRESEVVKGRRRREKRALLEDVRRYNSDSLGSSVVWRARESFGVMKTSIIEDAKAVEYEGEAKTENEREREKCND